MPHQLLWYTHWSLTRLEQPALCLSSLLAARFVSGKVCQPSATAASRLQSISSRCADAQQCIAVRCISLLCTAHWRWNSVHTDYLDLGCLPSPARELVQLGRSTRHSKTKLGRFLDIPKSNFWFSAGASSSNHFGPGLREPSAKTVCEASVPC